MSETSEDFPPPSASLYSLPIEIKAQIVKLAKLQDDSFQSRKNSDSVNIKAVAALPTRSQYEWKGKSLLSLHLVNKEFSELAASHLFARLRSCRTNQFFQFSLLSNYYHHIQSLELDMKATAQEIKYALSISALLPFLTKLSLAEGCARLIQHNSYQSFLKPVCSRIQILSINDKSLSNVTEFIKFFPNLQELEIHQAAELTTSTDSLSTSVTALGSAILELKGLKKLTLQSEELELYGYLEWSELVWSSCSLATLTIISEMKSAPSFQLATLFSHSLETLSIKSARDTSLATEFSSRHKFPVLRELTLLTCQVALPALLLAFSVPLIRQLDLMLCDYENGSQMQLLPVIGPFIAAYPNLQTLKLRRIFIDSLRNEFTSPSYIHPNRHLRICFEQYLDLADLPMNSTIRVDSLPREVLEETSSALLGSFSEVLDFGKILFEEVAKEGNNEALYKMGGKLDWIRAEMLERKD